MGVGIRRIGADHGLNHADRDKRSKNPVT